MKKTFKIGEYAIGGIIQVEIVSNLMIVIKALDWDSKEVIACDSSERQSYIESKLYEWTSCYYADKIMEYVNKNTKKVLTYH